ncbi:MAG: amidohydrolase family protein [Rubrivivax sp.]
MKIFDVNTKPPLGENLKLRVYANGVAAGSRRKRGLPSDPAFEQSSMDLFLQQHRAAGVVHTLIHAREKGPGAYPANPHEGVTNEFVADLCSKYPGEFTGVCSVDPAGDKLAPEKAERLLQSGFTALELLPGYMAEVATADDRRMFPTYEVCVKLGRPVFLLNGGNAGPDVGYSDPVHVDRVAAAFPQLKIIVCYGGWPYVQQLMGLVYRRPNVWVMPDSYFPCMPGEQDYLAALKTYARERFLFSFYYPLNPQREHLDRVLSLGLSPSVLERYLYANAVELFGIDP